MWFIQNFYPFTNKLYTFLQCNFYLWNRSHMMILKFCVLTPPLRCFTRLILFSVHALASGWLMIFQVSSKTYYNEDVTLGGSRNAEMKLIPNRYILAFSQGLSKVLDKNLKEWWYFCVFGHWKCTCFVPHKKFFSWGISLCHTLYYSYLAIQIAFCV